MHNLAWRCHKRTQDMHFGRGEQNGCAIGQHDLEFRGKEFDLTAAEADIIRPAILLDTAHHGLDTSDQFLVIIGFANIIIRADTKTLQFCFDAILSSHENKRSLISLSTQLLRKLKTIDIGHHDVEDEQVRFALLDHLHGTTRVIGRFNFVAFLAEHELNECVCETIIINDKNVHVSLPLLSNYMMKLNKCTR